VLKHAVPKHKAAHWLHFAMGEKAKNVFFI